VGGGSVAFGGVPALHDAVEIRGSSLAANVKTGLLLTKPAPNGVGAGEVGRKGHRSEVRPHVDSRHADDHHRILARRRAVIFAATVSIRV
jgi:hypothetical protein